MNEPLKIRYSYLNVFEVIVDIDEPFHLHYCPPNGTHDYGLWRAVILVETHPLVGKGVSEQVATRLAIQQYLLRFPEGHRKGE
jgi:hypothetical protein